MDGSGSARGRAVTSSRLGRDRAQPGGVPGRGSADGHRPQPRDGSTSPRLGGKQTDARRPTVVVAEDDRLAEVERAILPEAEPEVRRHLRLIAHPDKLAPQIEEARPGRDAHRQRVGPRRVVGVARRAEVPGQLRDRAARLRRREELIGDEGGRHPGLGLARSRDRDAILYASRSRGAKSRAAELMQ